MKHADYIYNELKEISPFLAELEKFNVFYVPENYFSNLDREILNKIISDRFHILPAAEPLSFTLPEGYFENLAQNILQKIKSLDSDDTREELRQVSPLLYSPQNENVFTVPAGYFENFPNTILSMVKPKAKVVVMKKRSIVWNCAAAAILMGIMAVSALWTNHPLFQQSTVTADNKTMPFNIKDAFQFKNEQQINEGIEDLSDTDIVKYLETTGSNADDEALASDIPEKELPEEQDYLNDENTLQIFLGNTNSKNKQN